MEYSRELPPLREMQPDSRPNDYGQPVPSISELTHASPRHTMTPVYAQTPDPRAPPPQVGHAEGGSPESQARLALKLEGQMSNGHTNGNAIENMTEKEKMIKGELYTHNTPDLQNDRRKCKAALIRFNRAEELGTTPADAMAYFKGVIDPSGSEGEGTDAQGAPMRGSLGAKTIIESPFRCDYGYNINIGENTLIHSNCTIVDACDVHIGSNCWIGHNVTILTSMASVAMAQRKGVDSRYQGRPTFIDDDCYIGAGAVIYPGVRLNRGSFVGPGETVNSDIVMYGWVGYKPAFMT